MDVIHGTKGEGISGKCTTRGVCSPVMAIVDDGDAVDMFMYVHSCQVLTLDQRTVIDIPTDLALMANFTLHCFHVKS